MTGNFRDIANSSELALLSVEQMMASDAASIAAGIAGTQLMAAAGNVVYEAIVNRIPPQRTLVLAGPGNNGGDGWVVAEKLRRAGWDVHVATLVPCEALKGDAAWAASLYKGEHSSLRGADAVEDCTLIIDALFGAGLARPLDEIALEVTQAINARGLDCVAIDVPSGIHGDTGQVMGAAPRCTLTVTFFRPKPGHLLLPGRVHCGELVVGAIGTLPTVFDGLHPTVFRNGPALWRHALRPPGTEDHKYTRGAVLIVAGAGMTGAARLAASGARQIGAGLVSILAPDAATAAVLRAGEAGVIVREGALADALADRRLGAVLLGPGGGVSDTLRQQVLAAVKSGVPTVLDADALSVFSGCPEALFNAISGPCLLTPHEGEYSRIFRDIAGKLNKLDKVRSAAKRSGATVLLKGADTVIADPSGRAVINDNAPPSLATAGSGDVLAGIAAGLLAQGLTPLAAGAAGAWLHGAAAQSGGNRRLIAEDLLTGLAHISL